MLFGTPQAEQSNFTKACVCPLGFKGDGIRSCEGIDKNFA